MLLVAFVHKAQAAVFTGLRGFRGASVQLNVLHGVAVTTSACGEKKKLKLH